MSTFQKEFTNCSQSRQKCCYYKGFGSFTPLHFCAYPLHQVTLIGIFLLYHCAPNGWSIMYVWGHVYFGLSDEP